MRGDAVFRERGGEEFLVSRIEIVKKKKSAENYSGKVFSFWEFCY